MQRLGSFPLHCGFSCAFFCNAVNARQVGATAWFVSAALWIQLCVFCNAVNARQVGQRLDGFGSFPLHCGFSCAFFLQRSERTPGRCNGFGSFPLHCGFSCAFFCNAVNARQVGATAWFVSADSLWIQLCVFLQRSERTPGRCNGLVRFHCIVDSVDAFFATQ